MQEQSVRVADCTPLPGPCLENQFQPICCKKMSRRTKPRAVSRPRPQYIAGTLILRRRDIIVLSSNAADAAAWEAPCRFCSDDLLFQMSLLGPRQTSRWFPLPSFKRNPPHRPCRAHLDWPLCSFSVHSGFGICSFVSVLRRNLLDYVVSESLCLSSGSLGCRSQLSRVCARRTCVCVILCARATEPGARKPSFPLFLRIASACVYLRV